MRREAFTFGVVAIVLATGCSKLERLSIVKPTAERGDWKQVAPKYEVSDKGRDAAPVAALQLLALATEAYRAGKPDLAAQQARQALKIDPKLADAHNLLAAIASGQGDAAAAGRHYQQALALAPDAGAYANNYGTWLCANGRAMESLGWFEKALADLNYPTRAAAFANAGSCANRAGLAERAEANWRQALALEPDELQSLAGMAALQYGRAQYLDARAFAERWLALAPLDPEGLQLASQIELKLGDTAASARYLHKLQALPAGAANIPRAQ